MLDAQHACDSLLPRGESLRRAVRWLALHGDQDARGIEEVSLRFDLGPLEEEFLLRYFRAANDARRPRAGE